MLFSAYLFSSSHKTLRGPRAGLIFFRKDLENAKDLEKRVNDAVFPACQGGPHNQVRAVCISLRLMFMRLPIVRRLLPLPLLCIKLLSPPSRYTLSRSSPTRVPLHQR